MFGTLATLHACSSWDKACLQHLLNHPADADRILPITAPGLRTAKLIKGARLRVVKDGPHCITWTHAEEVNSELASTGSFDRRPARAPFIIEMTLSGRARVVRPEELNLRVMWS